MMDGGSVMRNIKVIEIDTIACEMALRVFSYPVSTGLFFQAANIMRQYMLEICRQGLDAKKTSRQCSFSFLNLRLLLNE